MTDDVSAPMTHPGSTHMPDDHAGHDRQLVVAFASGDLPPDDTADAQALVARCRRCAALVDEITRISGAMRLDLVAPPRPRDFRISGTDAERLRGSALTRLMRRLASPRLQVLQPLAGAAMVIGLLLVVATAVPLGFSSAGAAPAMSTVATGDDTARDAAGGAQAPAAAEVAPGSPGAEPAASALAAQSPDIAAYTDTSTKANVVALAASSPPVDPVVPVGAGLVIVGALLLILRLEARRATRDPLLR